MSSRRCNVPIVHVIVALDIPQILGIVVSLYIDFHWPKWQTGPALLYYVRSLYLGDVRRETAFS